MRSNINLTSNDFWSLLEQDPLRGKPCTHAGGFQALASAKLIAGCDINKSRLETFGRQWSVDRLYTDYQEMLIKENLDTPAILFLGSPLTCDIL